MCGCVVKCGHAWLSASPRNRFTGSIPVGLGRCVSLTNLDASNCRLNGVIERGFLRGALRLERLDCHRNMICGPLPGEELAALSRLRELNLSENKLTGLVAVEMPNRLRSLERLILSHNFLRDRLPSTLMNLKACT